MFRNYFTIAIRNFWRHKFFTLINVLGLAIGICAALVIYLIVQHELTYDKFHKDGDRIYRVVSNMQFPGMTMNISGVPVPMAKAAREELSGLETVTHFLTQYETNVSPDGNSQQQPKVFRKQQHVIYADEYYFTLINYDWLQGDAGLALVKPFSVVLTESRARMYFPGTELADIPGRTLTYNDSIRTTVTGIVKDFKVNTDFVFTDFISRSTIENSALRKDYNWEEWRSISSGSQLLVKLKTGANPGGIEKQIANLRLKYVKPEQEGEKDGSQHFLQPLKDIHFNPDFDAFDQRQAHLPTLYGLMAVAVFLLLLGAINFINLSTAQASTRAKEIGIRKTLGGEKKQLILQFLSESFLLTVCATALSILLLPILLNVFRDFIPPGISAGSLNQSHVWLFLLLAVLLVSLMAGFYPALVLSRFNPVTAMKNQLYAQSGRSRSGWLRQSLTITQFVIAQFLLIATLIVSKQIHYSLNKDLGYKQSALVYFNTKWNWGNRENDNRRFTLLQKLKAIPEIENLSLAGGPPAENGMSSTSMSTTHNGKKLETTVEMKYADTTYFSLYGMKLLAGRNLHQSDTIREFVINETYARMMGFDQPEKAVGQLIDRGWPTPVVGVLADFHTKGTQQAIKPLAYSAATGRSRTIHLALKPKDNDPELWNRGLKKVEAAYKEVYPEEDFEYHFFDESIATFYKAEQNISRLLKWATGLSIFISCLGLLGLAIYSTNSRKKEIGVRKVLGASVPQVTGLLLKDFLQLVLLAILIAVPLGWWAMYNWLQDFSYRTGMSWWVFAATGTGMMLIAILILSVQTVRAASANPVENLKTE